MVARVFIVILAVLAAGLFGANYVWLRSPASQIVPIRTGDDPALVAFQREVEAAYETKGVDYMENWANTLRRDESRAAGGTTRLYEFYNVLLAIECQCRDGYRMLFSFEDRRTRLEAWLHAYPQSITANLAMAALWEYRSWQVVGGYENENPLSPEQQEEFLRSRETARSYVEHLKIADDPYVALFKMRILPYFDAPQGEMTRLFDESLAAWPRHFQIYFLYAKTLTWMYRDQMGQIRLMQTLAAAKDDPDKQVGLSFIVGSMFRGFGFGGWNVSWEDVKHAYAVRRERYGWRNRDLNAFCYMAIENRDWETAKNCMREINGHWDDVVWLSQNQFVWNELIVSLH